MSTTDLELPPEARVTLQALAKRHDAAGHRGIAIINALGGQAEKWMRQLPPTVQDGLGSATQSALTQAMRAARASRNVAGDPPDWLNTALGAAMGAAGGFGGMGTALAELPVTTTLLLRVIQQEAAAHGFDPAEDSVAFDCLKVFGSAGPLAADDGAESAFLAARMTLNGAALQRILQVVAPRLAAALGQKLAAQAVPVLGAAAGAAINAAYLSYYRDMAHVSFGLRKLAVEMGLHEATLLAAFTSELGALRKP